MSVAASLRGSSKSTVGRIEPDKDLGTARRTIQKRGRGATRWIQIGRFLIEIDRYNCRVKTRYLLFWSIGLLVVILAASAIWFITDPFGFLDAT